MAINRHVAGVHFPIDSAAGAMIGLTLAGYLVQRFQQKRTFRAWSFNGQHYPETRDFHWSDWYDVSAAEQTAPNANAANVIQDNDPDPLGEPSPILDWLWKKALAEWR